MGALFSAVGVVTGAVLIDREHRGSVWYVAGWLGVVLGVIALLVRVAL